jgi:SAM-dependent methyltransferase
MSNSELIRELQENYYGKDLVTKTGWYNCVAEAYDGVRPRYSEEIVDFALSTAKLPAKARILEIGCGPAVATTSFASRGFELVCLEPSYKACQLARKNCAAYPDVEIVQTTLEEWLVTPEKFDAALAATSIHWVSPEIGYLKIAQALKENGWLILLWNAGLQPSTEINQLLIPIYQAYAPSLKPFKGRKEEREDLQALGENAVNSGYFNYVATKELIIEVTYSISDYLLLLSTYSPYIALTNESRQNLFKAIEECLQETCGEGIMLSYLSMVQLFNSK